MIARPPRSTRTDTLCPYTTLFRSLCRHAGAQRDIGIPFAAECALPARTVPQRACHRRLDHSEQDLAVLDQGDVDGELAVALDELARAVERIDHPQTRPRASHRGWHCVGR